MKAKDIEVGMRIFRERGLVGSNPYNEDWCYGTIVSEPFEEKNAYRGLWKVEIKFDNGTKRSVPLNRIQPTKRTKKEE